MLPRQPGKAGAFIGTEYIDRRDHVVMKMPGETRDWQVKCVCGGTDKTCNGGWMRRIENAAKPVLVPLITGQQMRISPAHQQVISAWASLKAMVAEYGLGGGVTVHHTQRKRMRDKQLPPAARWGVWVGQYERDKWKPEWVSRPLLILPEKQFIKRGSREPTYFNSNSTTQVIGKLFICIIHTPMPGLIERWRFALPHGGSLFRIWPPTTFSITWPGKIMSDKDADVAATSFAAKALEIGRRTARQGTA